LCELDAELDWAELGAHYCEGDAETFFDDGLVERMRDVGLRLAADLAEKLGEQAASSPRTSLYVGAGVFELPPILCETLVLGRRVVVHTLESAETREIARAMAAVAARTSILLTAFGTEPLPHSAPCSVDHAWLVSVLTDPDAFPALHDELYQRHGTPLATARGDSGHERARARDLVSRLCSGLTPDALVTTTDEELPWIEEAAAEQGARVEVPDRARLSGIVGDAVRLCRWRGGRSPGSRSGRGKVE
jgi:hypothetical protein